MSRTPQERPMIAETLRQAIADKEWTISQAAREADVDRTFLSRLLAGHPPPRARDGRRSAELDPRYSQIASALGLNPQTFLNQVRKEQELRSTSEGDDYAELLSRAMADIQRQYDPDTVAELNLVVRQLVPTMIDEGGPMELYRRLLGEPALARRRQGTNSGLNDANVNNHRGRDPLWVDDNLPTLCEALIELGYRCHTVQADVGLDVRFDLAAVLQKLGTREPAHIRRILGIDA